VKPIRPPMRRALLLVCEDCGKSSRSVRKALKRGAKGLGSKKDVRVAMVGCLDVCPKDRVTVAVVGTDTPPRFVICDGPDDAGAVLDLLR
jgi:hypothetical protein